MFGKERDSFLKNLFSDQRFLEKISGIKKLLEETNDLGEEDDF